MARKKDMLIEASIPKRALAFALDILIIELVIGFPFQGLIERYVPENPLDALMSGASDPALMKIGAAISLLALLYFALFEYRMSQTPGKMLFRIYVANDLKEKGLWQYFARSMYFIPIFPFVMLWVVDPIYMMFDKKRRRLSEMLSKTSTVEKVDLR